METGNRKPHRIDGVFCLYEFPLHLPNLEVVSDPNHRVRDVIKPVDRKGTDAGQIGRFDQNPAILSANIEAGADLVSDSATVIRSDAGLALAAEAGGAPVEDRPEEVTAAAALEKGIEV